ncbi:MAG: transporter substrate-binding domain-containing protein [Clostridiales bacterium]|nr:transporter substrate-binding domain-containing protein [Clostridiales bacterium]
MKRIASLLLAMMLLFGLAACNGGNAEPSGVEDGVLTIAMECAYAPYNWVQPDDSDGAVPIKDSNEYVNGYDVMIAKKICEANGWELEVLRMEWGALVPAVQSGEVDAVIAGQSMTADRAQEVDFAGPYFYASIVCLTKQDGAYADAQGVSDLAGASCTAQLGTIWYDVYLNQIKDSVEVQPASQTAGTMLMALETGTVDFVCTDMPTAQGALIAYPGMKLLDFNGTDDNFEINEEDVNIGVSVRKGNTELKDAIDEVLSTMTEDDFLAIMEDAITIQPITE